MRSTGPRPRQKSLVIFFRSLALLAAAGISLYRAVEVLSKQNDEDERMQQVCHDIAQDLTEGKSLSRAMQNSRAFGNFHVQLVHVGEMTGRLDSLLLRLADHEEATYALQMKVKSALTYPAFTFLVTLVMLMMAPSMLFGGIFSILKNQGQELPWLTKVVMACAQATGDWRVVVLLGAAGFAGLKAFQLALRSPARALRFHRLLLTLPALGRMLQMVGSARFARSLGLQVEAGVPLLEALELAARSSQDPVLQSGIAAATKSLKGGAGLSESLQQGGYFPSQFLAMLTVGAEAGKLDDMLHRLASIFEAEVELAIDALTALLEPMVMLVMGLVVGVVVISIMLPMVKLLQVL